MNNGTVIMLILASLAGAGCSTPDVNPAVAKPKTGYVDFYTDSSLGLSWEVKREGETSGEMQAVFSEFKPVEGTILRLATPPGSHQFQVSINNRVTEGPQKVLVEVADGKVTPVHVTLTTSGSANVDRKVYGFRPSSKGYGRGTKIVSGQNEVFQIGAIAETPKAYQPKERMPYFSPAAQ